MTSIKCTNCGYDYGEHQFDTDHCSASNDGTVWRDTVYTTPLKLCASCSELRSALAAEQQHSAALREASAGYQDDNISLHAKLGEAQEVIEAQAKEIESYKRTC